MNALLYLVSSREKRYAKVPNLSPSTKFFYTITATDVPAEAIVPKAHFTVMHWSMPEDAFAIALVGDVGVQWTAPLTKMALNMDKTFEALIMPGDLTYVISHSLAHTTSLPRTHSLTLAHIVSLSHTHTVSPSFSLEPPSLSLTHTLALTSTRSVCAAHALWVLHTLCGCCFVFLLLPHTHIHTHTCASCSFTLCCSHARTHARTHACTHTRYGNGNPRKWDEYMQGMQTTFSRVPLFTCPGKHHPTGILLNRGTDEVPRTL